MAGATICKGQAADKESRLLIYSEVFTPCLNHNVLFQSSPMPRGIVRQYAPSPIMATLSLISSIFHRTSLEDPLQVTNTRQVGVRSYAEPERCLGECFAHDPGLIRRSSDGVYFRFNTDTYIDIMRSDSLSGPWETVGNVLPQGTVVDLPDVTALWVGEYLAKSAP